jgi:hypothetical protein
MKLSVGGEQKSLEVSDGNVFWAKGDEADHKTVPVEPVEPCNRKNELSLWFLRCHYISDTPIRMSSDTNLLPGITSVINLADSAEKDNFVSLLNMKEEPSDAADGLDAHVKVVCISISV